MTYTDTEAVMEEAGGEDAPTGRTLMGAECDAAHDRFVGHLMGAGRDTGCCAAPVGRYCDDGARLRRDYLDAYWRARERNKNA